MEPTEPVRIEWPDGEQWPNPGDYGWASGAGTAVEPPCEGCGAPVPWRDLRWEPVLDSAGRIVVGPGDAWHPGCRVRAGWSALAAAGEDLAESGRLAGQALVHIGRATVVAVGSVVATGVPIVVEQGRAAVAAAEQVLEGGRLAARRRVRSVRLEAVGRPVGLAAGVVVDRAARAGWRLDLVRSRVVQAVAEWRRGVGYTRAWRAALDGVDEVGPVVAPWEGWDVLPGGERFRALDPGEFDRLASAGQAGPAGTGWVNAEDFARSFREDVAEPFRRHYLRRFGPEGHGDVDTPSQQRRRAGQDRRGRQRPGQE